MNKTSNSNSMSIAEFVGAHFLWGFIAMICYRNLLRCQGDYSLLEARLILCGILIVVSVVGGLLEGVQRRNRFSVFLNLATGYGIYTAFTYAKIRSGLIVGTLIVAVILSLVFAVYLMKREIIHRKNLKRIIGKRVRQAVYLVQMFLGLGFAFIILELEMNFIFGSSVMSARVSEAYEDADEKAQALKIFKDAKIYMEEFDNYCDGVEDFDAYYTQQCEVDARAYAESRVEDYYKAIYE